MLERGGSGQASGLFQFFYQLPRVEGVEEVDVAWTAVEHFDGQLAFGHVDARRLLVRIASVL